MNFKKIIFTLLILTSVGCGKEKNSNSNSSLQSTENSPTKVKQDNRTLLFVLSGQSNMSGSSQDNLGPLPSDNVTIVKRQPNGEFLSERYMSYPNAGPTSNIARQLELKYPNRKIKIINAAMGGSYIIEWTTGGGAFYYPGMIEEVKKHLNEETELKALLWYQGEAEANLDSNSFARMNQYQELFTLFLSNFKKDLNQSNFQVVIAQICRTTNVKFVDNWKTMQDIQLLTAQSLHIPIVITEDLEIYDDFHIKYTEFDKLASRFVSNLK